MSMSDTSFYRDPYAQPNRGRQQSRLTDVRPRGYQVDVNPDGTASVIDPMQPPQQLQQRNHYENLAETMDETFLDDMCADLLEMIEEDKDSCEPRDKQYQEGLNRTGMGNNIIGGADFPGASRAVHPLLLESSVDFGAAMINEMLPAQGPCKTQVQGEENDQKDDKAKRQMRWMNYQFTEIMTGAYHEFEVGFTQCPLGGGFYTKLYVENGEPALAFIPVDHVYRPYSDADFYGQPRITHADTVDRWTFRKNVRSGLWRDVVEYDQPGVQQPEQTSSDEATDRIIGRNEPTRNLDAQRETYETSTIWELPENIDGGEMKPYLVTIDVQARKILSIYRNWREKDETEKRTVFLIEWPFWPWRGGPVGLTHMIGSLSGAATGSLRALLDAALLNTTQTAVRLKGGASSGGQTMQPRVTEISEVQGSLAMDDIRKAFMPIKFNEPSNVMLQLLGFLVDAGRGVVRSTYDDMDKFGSQTPVGTTQMFLEQGLRNLGSVHSRFHRAMKTLLKELYNLNQDTLDNATVIDTFGELMVTKADFEGPMQVIPVSDPKLFSELIRRALAQTIVARATATKQLQLNLYNDRAVESYFLRQMGVSNPDQFLVPNPQPQRQNAVAENVQASQGMPVKAFPGQDHEAHIKVHVSYLKSPLFGSNTALGEKYIPIMIQHLGEHLALWYSDAMLEAATQAIRRQTGNDQITLDSFQGEGLEAPLDQLMDELDDEVFELADEILGEVPDIIAEAKELLKQLQPPMPMDPSVVAADDVKRQSKKDDQDTKIKVLDLEEKRKAREAKEQQDQQKTDAQVEKDRATAEATGRKVEGDLEIAHRGMDQADDHYVQDQLAHAADLMAQAEKTEQDNQTRIDVALISAGARQQAAELQAETTKETAAAANESGEFKAAIAADAGQRKTDATNKSGERKAKIAADSSERKAKIGAATSEKTAKIGAQARTAAAKKAGGRAKPKAKPKSRRK